MKWIKYYKSFKESLQVDLQFTQIDLMESLNIWQDVLLSSINAEVVDIYQSLNLEKTIDKIDTEILFNSTDFINHNYKIPMILKPL
jgi:hypothetical protein